jgi:hypothetical protein
MFRVRFGDVNTCETPAVRHVSEQRLGPGDHAVRDGGESAADVANPVGVR